MGILEDSVTGSDADGYDFQCPLASGCGDPGTSVGFTSSGWSTRELAQTRGQQHFDEHKSGEAMPSLEDFRVDQGLAVADDGSVVKVEDLP